MRIEVFAPDATTKEIAKMVPACAGGSQYEAERKPFYIVCARCGNPYRVRLAEKEWIKGECPWCGNPIHVMRHENRLFERVDGKWEPMLPSRYGRRRHKRNPFTLSVILDS